MNLKTHEVVRIVQIMIGRKKYILSSEIEDKINQVLTYLTDYSDCIKHKDEITKELFSLYGLNDKYSSVILTR